MAGIVVNDDGQILVVQRRDIGEWQPPGGVLELDETIEDGLRREIIEETGIKVRVERLTGVYKNMRLGVVALVFRCEPIEGTLRKSSETAQVRWLSIDEAGAIMAPPFAIRVRDAFGAPTTVPLRSHDGFNEIK